MTLEAIISLVQDNKLQDALKACADHLNQHKDDADGWFIFAGINSRLGDIDKVIDSCNRVLALQPGHSAAAYNLGVALQSRHCHQDAIAAYRQCLAHQPANLSALMNLAVAYRETGKLQEAIDTCRQAMRIEPEAINLQNLLGLALKDTGKITDAIDTFARAIKTHPDTPYLHYNLGLCHEISGDIDAALSCYDRALELNHHYPEVHNTLGMLAARQGNFPAAETHFRKALELQPGYPQALNNLGALLVKQEKLDEAITCLEQAVSSKADYSDACNNLGLALQHKGDNKKALAAFTRAIESNPENAEAHNNIGITHLSLGTPDEAVTHHRRAIELKPVFPEAYCNLGNALLMLEDHRERYDEAERCYRRAIELKPGMAEAHFNLGTCLHPQSRFEEALCCYDRAIDLKPDYDDAVAGKSRVLERLGRLDEAYDAVAPLIDRGTTNMNVAIAFGILAKHSSQQEKSIRILKNIVDNNLDPRNINETHFLLGKLYDAGRQYEQAFRHYAIANSIDTPKYDHTETVSLHKRLMATFSRQKQASAIGATNTSSLPVFIVGMPRSGTSLVEQILSSHPQVFGAGELEDIGNISSTINKKIRTTLPYPECLDVAAADTLDEIADSYLNTLHELGGDARRVTDKMPHNFQALGLIERLFPGARVIHCRRDPVDTCLSIYFQHFNTRHPYSYDLYSLGIYYQQYLKLMEHWKTALSIPILEIDYEALVSDQEHQSRIMIEFVGLEWNDACLQFHTSDRVVATPSYDQVRQPIYRKSLQRWKHYEKYLEPLLAGLNKQQDASA